MLLGEEVGSHTFVDIRLKRQVAFDKTWFGLI